MRDEIADGLECHLKVISAIIRYYLSVSQKYSICTKSNYNDRTSYVSAGLENIMIFSKISKISSNKLYNNGCNTLMQYLMTISYQSFVVAPYVKT